MANNYYDVIPEPFYEASRKCWRIDYKDKTFRSDRISSSHKSLTDRQMKANVREKVRDFDWSVTGDSTAKAGDLVSDWCTYLGYRVVPYLGPQKQKYERYEPITDKPRVGEYTFDQYYRNLKNHVLPSIRSKRIGEVTRDDIKAIIDKMLNSGRYNSSTVEHVRKATRQFFEWQRIECKSIRVNPVHDIQIKKLKLNRDRRAGEPEEVQAIFDLMKYNHLLYACKMVYNTAMRPEEVCGMHDDYDYSSGVYLIEEVVTKKRTIKTDGKTENANREIILSDIATDDIKAQRQMKDLLNIKSVWLFPNAYGRVLTPKVMSDTFRHFARKAGSDLTLYELRHTATSILSDELSDRDLRDTVGHGKNMDTHKTYDHMLQKRRSEIRNKMNKAYENYEEISENRSGKIIHLNSFK